MASRTTNEGDPVVRTLLVDNYDSYTFNLFQLLAQVNGVKPLVVQNDDFDSWSDLLARYPSEHHFDNGEQVAVVSEEIVVAIDHSRFVPWVNISLCQLTHRHGIATNMNTPIGEMHERTQL
jgi:hypothetical protein